MTIGHKQKWKFAVMDDLLYTIVVEIKLTVSTAQNKTMALEYLYHDKSKFLTPCGMPQFSAEVHGPLTTFSSHFLLKKEVVKKKVQIRTFSAWLELNVVTEPQSTPEKAVSHGVEGGGPGYSLVHTAFSLTIQGRVVG